MVALQQPFFEVPPEQAQVAAARQQLEHLQVGLCRALLAAPEGVVRALAERAVHADAVVARRSALVGERPALDDTAHAAVMEAEAAYADASATRAEAQSRGHVLLAKGNLFALGCLFVAAVLYRSGMHPLATPVAAVVLAAAAGPVTAAVLVIRDRAAKSAAVMSARATWAEALEEAGVPTMGALAARRLEVAGWERRRREAEVAEEAAGRHRRAWQRLAGPGVPPEQVDAVLERVASVRQAQLALLAALLAARLALLPALVPADDRPPAGQLATGWVDEAFERIRSAKLHLWLRR